MIWLKLRLCTMESFHLFFTTTNVYTKKGIEILGNQIKDSKACLYIRILT